MGPLSPNYNHLKKRVVMGTNDIDSLGYHTLQVQKKTFDLKE